MLNSPRFADCSVATIAFACGFGDLSYFNRTFRLRFGTTPTGARAEQQPGTAEPC
jgi:transcriptional regulator GlxA family with amidase domain